MWCSTVWSVLIVASGVNWMMRYATIGKFCPVAWNCSIGGTEHHIHRLTTSFFPFDKTYGIVDDNYLEDLELAYADRVDVWIAANTQVLRSVTVGHGAVIGGTIVTKDVLPYEIWAGIPAKKIGQRFSNEIILD